MFFRHDKNILYHETNTELHYWYNRINNSISTIAVNGFQRQCSWSTQPLLGQILDHLQWRTPYTKRQYHLQIDYQDQQLGRLFYQD